eukprot:6214545-Pleurochrysis_carterae.AAC.5
MVLLQTVLALDDGAAAHASPACENEKGGAICVDALDWLQLARGRVPDIAQSAGSCSVWSQIKIRKDLNLLALLRTPLKPTRKRRIVPPVARESGNGMASLIHQCPSKY